MFCEESLQPLAKTMKIVLAGSVNLVVEQELSLVYMFLRSLQSLGLWFHW